MKNLLERLKPEHRERLEAQKNDCKRSYEIIVEGLEKEEFVEDLTLRTAKALVSWTQDNFTAFPIYDVLELFNPI